ncbi:MAG TPA: hypothetical protein VM618_13255, partial [Acidimicrobiia bacterium]|nr:hypothetical protein [Acidimicrobiia bacterium]
MGDGTHRRRRALWRAVSIAAFVGLAAGTTGGVPSILERWQGDRVYGQGTAAAAPAPPPAPSTAPPDTAPPST